MPRWGAAAAEAIGTFALVFVGCGAIMADALGGGLGTVGIAVAFGLVVAAMVYATGHISGAHLNPAVTVAFAAAGHFPWRRVPGYVAAQSTGAIGAALLLRSLLGPVAGVGSTAPASLLTTPGVLIIEVLITMVLMFVIASVATDGRATSSMAGVAIGSAVAMAALFAGPLTGASMNPARSLGPALASGELAWLPMYILAPAVGAIAGALAYETVRRVPATPGPVVRAFGAAPASGARGAAVVRPRERLAPVAPPPSSTPAPDTGIRAPVGAAPADAAHILQRLPQEDVA